MRLKVIRFLFITLMVFGGVFVGGEAFADEPGGWINEDATTSSSSGGGSGGGAGETTWSWIYYQSTTDESLDELGYPLVDLGNGIKGFPFVPSNWFTNNSASGAETLYISSGCSGKTSDGTPKGFWHLGTNNRMRDARGLASNLSHSSCQIFSFEFTSDMKLPGWPNVTVIDNPWPQQDTCNVERIGYNYSGSVSGAYGHNSTRSGKDFSTGTFSGWRQMVPPSVNHEIYYGYDMIFKATASKDASQISGNDYIKAYKATHGGVEPSESGIPGNVYGFCYWEGMDEPPKETHFEATSSVTSINDVETGIPSGTMDTITGMQEFEITDSTATVKFRHEVTKTDNLDRETPNKMQVAQAETIVRHEDADGSVFTYQTSGTSSQGEHTGQIIDLHYAVGETLHGTEANSIGFTGLKAGDKITVCQNIKYFDVVDDNTFNDSSSLVFPAHSQWACTAIRVVSEFEGYSKVSSGANEATTGWTKSDKTKNLTLNSCNGGCQVSFEHGLRRASGNGTAYYVITKTDGTTEPGTVSADPLGKITTTRNIQPGEQICETLQFVNEIGASKTSATTKACVMATGSYGTEIDAKVKNSGVPAYNEFTNGPVYARPGNTVSYKGTYTPSAQSFYGNTANSTRIDGGALISNNGGTLGSVFNANADPDWKNAFSLYVIESGYSAEDIRAAAQAGIVTGTVGSAEAYDSTKDYTVKQADVGAEKIVYAKTNVVDNAKTTPKTVSIDNESGNSVASVTTESIEDTARFIVPYNFNTSVSIGSGIESNAYAYAGEDLEVPYEVKVLGKNNALINNDFYATIVRQPKISIIVYNGAEKAGNLSYGGDPCAYFGGTGCQTTLVNNPENPLNPSGSSEWTFGGTSVKTSIAVPDTQAGSQSACVAVAVYPANSGSDSNLSVSGSGTWNISASKCLTVAKRPSIQVWGGDMWTNSVLALPFAEKKRVADVNLAENTAVVFGSWVEKSILAPNSPFYGVASGASVGYYGKSTDSVPQSNRTPIAGLGGSNEGNVSTPFCTIRSPLTFPNNCTQLSGYYAVGGTGSPSVSPPSDKTSVIGDLNSLISSGAVSCYAGTREDGCQVSGQYTIPAATVAKGSALAVKATGNIIISGNITYADGGFNEASEVPKMIIYSKQSIKIACSVTRVDAVLIADGDIDTCYDVSDVNAAARSNFLKITGSTISDTMTANRTYGASTGIYSAIPAEVVDYDSSLYFWGFTSTSGTVPTSTSYEILYQKELPVRY